jgi:hypothetical protein
MKGSCVLFLLSLKNKLEWFILAPLLSEELIFCDISASERAS